MSNQSEKKKQNLFIQLIRLLWIGSVLVNIKSIFADFDYDASYAMAMSYRNLMGDRMFLEMREPHQTSAFFLRILESVFIGITGKTAYLALFLQFSGVLIYALATFILFRFLRKYTTCEAAHFASILFFTFRPKYLVLMEFSNMQILFSVFLFLFLMEALFEHKKRNLVLSAIFLCLEILSYPACLLTFAVVLVILLIYAKNRLKDSLLFSAVCLTCGIIYIGYFASRLGFSGLLSVPKMLSTGDSYHGSALLSLSGYLKEFLIGLAWLSVSAASAFLLARIMQLIKQRKNPNTDTNRSFFCIDSYVFFSVYGILLVIGDTVLLFLTANGGRYAVWMFGCSMLFPLMILTGFRCLSACDNKERILFISGVLISTSSFFAVMLLTNLSLISIVGYLILGGMISMIPICRYLKSKKEQHILLFPILLCLTIILHRGIAIRDYAQGSATILGIRNIVRSGPCAGITCGYLAYYQNKCDYPLWCEQIKENDSLLIITHWTVDSSLYLYSPSSVSHYSTISTPTYDESLLQYWSEYPEKYPTILAVECWFGTSYLDPNSAIAQWIDDHYEVCAQGSYWWFYRPKTKP